ncbi:transcriptional regulator, HxlR family [Butyrivibrio fibrisolvens]|uniref:Transcriptional regulator, HxlR family n=1 Tax=Butyrivibrio fibrisolvens TaxID=831 RepID=A0A1H9V9P6_BUTFI|nr:helix-turn-helix domain-containing protein [Butyrivibrio fibrisolvens]SES18405.1 transcriptional regulator, HxlR family [Butyrivibrio fibrisolvens]
MKGKSKEEVVVKETKEIPKKTIESKKTTAKETTKSKEATAKKSARDNSAKDHEPLCEDLAGKNCGLKKVLDIIGGKWKIMILCVIDKEGTVRYGDLSRRVFGITNTMLANSLKEMEADGLVERKQYMEMPVRVEYSLTQKAESIIPILLQLKKWGEENLPDDQEESK